MPPRIARYTNRHLFDVLAKPLRKQHCTVASLCVLRPNSPVMQLCTTQAGSGGTGVQCRRGRTSHRTGARKIGQVERLGMREGVHQDMVRRDVAVDLIRLCVQQVEQREQPRQ